MQCPTCGQEVANLVGGMCASCASARKPFLDVPDVVDVVRCAHCNRMDRKGIWQIAPPDVDLAVQQKLREVVEVDGDLDEPELAFGIEWDDPRTGNAAVRLTGKFHGYPVERSKDTHLRLRRSACQDCSREHGGYFEAILQVRGSDDRFERDRGGDVAELIARELRQHKEDQRTGAYASRSDRVRGGFDLYMGSLEITRLVGHDLAKRFGAEYAESSKLVGRKDGRDLLRFTILVRMPPYEAGDFILFDDILYKVLRHQDKLLSLWDVRRAEQVQREHKRAKTLKVIGRKEDEKEAVVVSRRGRDLQVLDPYTLRTVDLRLPFDAPEAPTIRVFRHDEQLWPVPALP